MSKTDKGHLVASIKKQGDKYEAMYEGETETFDTFDDATTWVIQQEETATDTPELAASEMSEADAVAINSNVNTTTPAGANASDIHA